MKKGESFYITSTSTGCMVSLSENTELKNKLCRSGLHPVETALKADLILINTCAVTSSNEEKTIEQMKKLCLPNKKIIVMGCFPAINHERFQKEFPNLKVLPAKPELILKELGLELISFDSPELNHSVQQNYGQSFSHKLISLLRLKKRHLPFIHKYFPYYANLLDTAIFNPDFSNISIGEGCLGTCTYCSIKKARGAFQSRPLKEILKNFSLAYEKGQRHFCLIAGDAGCWGHEDNLNLSHLLKELYTQFPQMRLSVSYISPQWLIRDQKELLPYFKDQRLIFVGLPIQSGSLRLLQICSRPYNMDDLIPLLKEIKEANPHVILKTDLIAKLPTETAYDLELTRKVLPYFDTIYLQNFSLRPGGDLKDMPSYESHFIDRFHLKCAIKFQHMKGFAKSLLPRI